MLTNWLLWDELRIGQMSIYLHLVNMPGLSYWLIDWVFLFKIMLVVAHVFSRLLASALWQLPALNQVI
jgi:hypothetical protein